VDWVHRDRRKTTTVDIDSGGACQLDYVQSTAGCYSCSGYRGRPIHAVKSLEKSRLRDWHCCCGARSLACSLLLLLLLPFVK